MTGPALRPAGEGQIDAPLPAAPHRGTKGLPDASVRAPLLTRLGMPAGVVPVTRVRPGEESDQPDSKDH